MSGCVEDVSVSQVVELLHHLEVLGHDRGDVLAESAITWDESWEHDRPLPVEAIEDLLRAAERVSGDPLIGLRLGRASGLKGVPGTQVRAQPDLARGLELFGRVRGFERRDEGDLTWLMGPTAGDSSDEARHRIEAEVGRLDRYFRDALPDCEVLCEVRFPHEPGGREEDYAVTLAPARLRFRQARLELGVQTAALGLPSRTADPSLAASLAHALPSRLNARSSGPSMRGQVERLIARRVLAAEMPSAREIAAELTISERSLRRGLRAAGTSFRGLVSRAQQTRAHELLRDPGRTVSQVAGALGFSDLAAFTKAFKRWTGVSPTEHRSRPDA
ncbi:MAG: helix-turn-helix domain-containing protein [Acidobacteriota bacterium]